MPLVGPGYCTHDTIRLSHWYIIKLIKEIHRYSSCTFDLPHRRHQKKRSGSRSVHKSNGAPPKPACFPKPPDTPRPGPLDSPKALRACCLYVEGTWALERHDTCTITCMYSGQSTYMLPGPAGPPWKLRLDVAHHSLKVGQIQGRSDVVGSNAR